MQPKFIILSLACLAACNPHADNVVNNPQAISLEDAMYSLGKSFNKFNQGLAEGTVTTKGGKLGVVPCSIDVNFKINAAGSDTLNAGVTGTRTGQLTVVSPSLSYQGTQNASRSNDITIKFVHVSCLQKDTLGFDNPEGVTKLINALKGEGGSFFANEPFQFNINDYNNYLLRRNGTMGWKSNIDRPLAQ